MGERRLSWLSRRWLRRLKLCSVILVVLLGCDLLLDAVRWPFTERGTVGSLERVSACDVRIAKFHKLFFPHPGYVAEQVVFSRPGNAGVVTLAKIQRLRTTASWFAILSLTHRLRRMELAGLEVDIPKQVPAPIHRKSKAVIPTTVTDLFAPGAVLKITSKNDSAAEEFHLPQFHLTHLAKNKAVGVQATILDTHLIGEAEVTASVGPVQFKNVAETKLAGSFQLSNLGLDRFRAVSGQLFSSGHFEGQLSNAVVTGSVSIPKFEVTHSGHAELVGAHYQGTVNGLKGDVVITRAEVHFLHSTLMAKGSVAGVAGKTVVLNVDSQNGPVQDLLHVFVQSDPAPLDGELSMHAHVVIPPGRESFLQRVRIGGQFEIRQAIFTHETTQTKLDELSARASGPKNRAEAKHVTAQIASRVEVANEIATLSDAVFAVPDAIARGGGTYDLKNEAIDLRGRVAMHASLSQAAGGIKSIFLIPLDPFFKKGGAGAVLPVQVSGTYSHPTFKMKL